MRGLDEFSPLGCADSARRNLVTYLVYKNFCRSSRETSHACLFEGGEIITNRDAAERGAVQDLFRRETVDMQIRQRFLQGPTTVYVMPTVDTRGETGLNANLCGAQIKGFLRAPNDFFGG